MRSLLYLVTAMMPALPVSAACLTEADFDFEVGFLHKDGGETRVTLSEDEPGAVLTEYRDTGGEPLRWTWSRHGIYPVGEQMNVSVVGVEDTTPWPMHDAQTETVLNGDPPPPVAGGVWSGHGVDKRRAADGEREWPFQVTYAFDAEKVVTLSGCRYRTVGVVAEFTSDEASWSARWVYFPDFDMAVQTRGRDSRYGGDWANGLIGIDN